MASRLKSIREYPRWVFSPKWMEKPSWVGPLVEVFSGKRESINSASLHKKSNEVLSELRPGLERLGFVVEGGENKNILRPVHFGEYGYPGLQYHIDSFNEHFSIALEVEAGRSTRGNAIYRDIVQTSLLVGVQYFVLAVPQEYSFESNGRKIVDKTYEICKDIFDAIYGGERLRLPFSGVLLIGY